MYFFLIGGTGQPFDGWVELKSSIFAEVLNFFTIFLQNLLNIEWTLLQQQGFS